MLWRSSLGACGHGPWGLGERLLRGELARDQVEGEIDRLLDENKPHGCETDLLAMPWECKVPCLGALTFSFARTTSYESFTSNVYVLDGQGVKWQCRTIGCQEFLLIHMSLVGRTPMLFSE